MLSTGAAAGAAENAWLDLRDVHLSRGGRPVLCGLTAVMSGRAIGLVGANGAGKSTLIGAVLGVLRPAKGSIKVLGCEVPARAMDLRARAGVMAEQSGVFPGSSGIDAVAFSGELAGLTRREALRRAHRALDALEVGEERYRPVAEYSTGMRQRCRLAMCLVADPEVLILDEPTVGLDPYGRSELLRLVRDLRDQGRRILVSTHILSDAEYVCDEMLLLRGGVAAYAGPVSELVGVSDTLITASGPGVDAVFTSALLAAGLPFAEASGAHVRFAVRSDEDFRTFWRLAAEHGVQVRRLAAELRRLEDAVVEAMEGRS
jgi:ABC-2 type transport system ATP-binding protein